jgi:PAS domain S-box-containing protein
MIKSNLGRLLVVDDETETLTPLCDLLSEWGYEVTGYTSCRESLEALKKQDFDLLLADLVMPEMDGIELMKAAMEIAPLIVCIIITGKGTIQTAVEAMKISAFDYVLKPIEWKTFKPILSRAMDVCRLRRSEEKYRVIIEDLTELICRFLPDGTLTFVNEAYCHYFGMKSEELVGKSFMPFIPEEDREMVHQQFNSLSLENPVVTYEHRVILPNGGIRWHQWTDRAIFDGQGQVIEFQSVGRDITERKLAEEALRESEEQYRELASSITDVFFAMDKDLKYIYWNKASENLTGISEKDAIGKSIYELFPDIPEMRRAEGIYLDVLRTQQPQNFINRYQIGDKEYVFEINAYPSKQGLSVFVKDITERKQAEKELKRSHKQLRALAARLSEVEEAERLRLAQELHDQVGQNLTALGINLNILPNLLSVKSTVRIGERLKDSQKLLEETIEKIRDVMADLRPSVLDDYGLLAAIRWYGEQFSNRTNIDIMIHGEELKPRLPMSVETTMFRISQEALTNIAKHSHAKKAIINLKEIDDKVQLSIADDGIGFDPETVYKMKKEMVWGLHAMKERAEALGGKFIVESKPVKGTKIIVEIKRQNPKFEYRNTKQIQKYEIRMSKLKTK